MAKIYLKKVPELHPISCEGCYFFNNETKRKTCKEKQIGCMMIEHIIYVKTDPTKPPMLGDMEECLPHQYPEFDPHYRGDPHVKTEDSCGRMIFCSGCKNQFPLFRFRKILVKIPFLRLSTNPLTNEGNETIYEDIYAYACRNCGTIRLKPEDL